MSISEDLTVTDCTGECLDRSNVIGGTRSVVVHVDGMLHCQRPSSSVFNLTPVKTSMYHVGLSGRGNKTNCTFSCSVLPFGTHTTVTNRFGTWQNLMNDSFALEDAIVSVVGLDIHALVQGHTLKIVQCIDGVCGIQSILKRCHRRWWPRRTNPCLARGLQYGRDGLEREIPVDHRKFDHQEITGFL